MFPNKTKFPVARKEKKYTEIQKIVGERFYGNTLYYRVIFSDSESSKPSWVNSRVPVFRINTVSYTLPENLKMKPKQNTLSQKSDSKPDLIFEWNHFKMTIPKFMTIVTEERYNDFLKTFMETWAKKKGKKPHWFLLLSENPPEYSADSILIRFAVELINKYYYSGLDTNPKFQDHIDIEDSSCVFFIVTMDLIKFCFRLNF